MRSKRLVPDPVNLGDRGFKLNSVSRRMVQRRSPDRLRCALLREPERASGLEPYR